MSTARDSLVETALLRAVVVFPVSPDLSRVLLGVKGFKIGKGLWNGYGGGIESGETPVEAAVREVAEESQGVQLEVAHLSEVGSVHFHNSKSTGAEFTCRMHVFLARRWKGEFRETTEMLSPTWFRTTDLPLDRMLLADRDWLPLVLQGNHVTAEAWYGPFQQTLLRPTETRVRRSS
jgi:ADP-ribose pyrophosphatase YjhB (NUDIX family)